MTHLCRFSAPVCRTFVLSLLTTNQPTNAHKQLYTKMNIWNYIFVSLCYFAHPARIILYIRDQKLLLLLLVTWTRNSNGTAIRMNCAVHTDTTYHHHQCVCVCVCQTNMCFDDLRHCESPMMMPASVPHTTYYIITVEKLANRRHKANSNKIV